MYMQVYSKMGNSLRVHLYDTSGDEPLLINKVLVREDLAENCDEPYPSKVSPFVTLYAVTAWSLSSILLQLAHVQAVAAQDSKASAGRKGGKYQSISMTTVPWVDEDKAQKHYRGRKVGVASCGRGKLL